MRKLATLFFVISSLIYASLLTGQAYGAALYGKGNILIKDASGMPLSGVTVAVLSSLSIEGEWVDAKEGKDTVVLTDEKGIASPKVYLGRDVIKFKLFGSTQNYKTVDVKIVKMKVIKEGYKEFEGEVPIFFASLRKKETGVYLYNVVLVSSDAQETSTVEETNFLIESTVSEPKYGKPGTSVVLTAKVHIPEVVLAKFKKDFFKIKTEAKVIGKVTLTDNGKGKDVQKDDGIYTAMSKLKKVKSGLFYINIFFDLGSGNNIVTMGSEKLKVGTVSGGGFLGQDPDRKLATVGLMRGVGIIPVVVGKNDEEAAALYEEYVKKMEPEK